MVGVNGEVYRACAAGCTHVIDVLWSTDADDAMLGDTSRASMHQRKTGKC